MKHTIPNKLFFQDAVKEPPAPCTSPAPAPSPQVTTEPKLKPANIFAAGDIREKAKKVTIADYNAKEEEKATKAKAKGNALLKDSNAKKDKKGKGTAKPKANKDRKRLVQLVAEDDGCLDFAMFGFFLSLLTLGLAVAFPFVSFLALESLSEAFPLAFAFAAFSSSLAL